MKSPWRRLYFIACCLRAAKPLAQMGSTRHHQTGDDAAGEEELHHEDMHGKKLASDALNCETDMASDAELQELCEDSLRLLDLALLACHPHDLDDIYRHHVHALATALHALLVALQSQEQWQQPLDAPVLTRVQHAACEREHAMLDESVKHSQQQDLNVLPQNNSDTLSDNLPPKGAQPLFPSNPSTPVSKRTAEGADDIWRQDVEHKKRAREQDVRGSVARRAGDVGAGGVGTLAGLVVWVGQGEKVASIDADDVDVFERDFMSQTPVLLKAITR